RDLLLDEFVAAMNSKLDGVSKSAYGDVLLLPRQAFMEMGQLERNDKCLCSLVTLNAARATCPHLRVLFVAHRWDHRGRPDGPKHEHYHTAVSFLDAHPELTHVFVDYSCVSQQQTTTRGYVRRIRAGHLRALPLVATRADALLLLPRREGRQAVRHTDPTEALQRGWVQLELLLARAARTPVHLHFRVGNQSRFVPLDLRASEGVAAAAAAAAAELLCDGPSAAAAAQRHDRALTFDVARACWSSTPEISAQLEALLDAAKRDLAAVEPQLRRQFLPLRTFDAAFAPASDALLGPVSKDEDRPELLRLLMYAAA
ncbi:hypothetical protein JKP88DRAFT_139145, partial [Tribonema minus]